MTDARDAVSRYSADNQWALADAILASGVLDNLRAEFWPRPETPPKHTCGELCGPGEHYEI